MSEFYTRFYFKTKITKKATKIGLGNYGLTELPDDFFELLLLEELYLSRNG